MAFNLQSLAPFPLKGETLMTVVLVPIREVDSLPPCDFKIFLGKISGKTPNEVLSAADEEIHGIFASPKKQSVSFAYLIDLLLLTSYIHVPPQNPDRRGPVPEQLKPTLRDLRLIPE
jgi:hypothetical protein